VPAKGKALIATDLSIACPPGTYGRVAPRSGLGMSERQTRLIDSGKELYRYWRWCRRRGLSWSAQGFIV
jgi:hypothetical protein